MPINNGFIEGTGQGGDVVVRIYYDQTSLPAGDNQPLVNGPRGFCLDVTNVSGGKASITVTPPSGVPQTFSVAKGDPVTTGQARSRTAVQVAAMGFTTRGDVSVFEID